MLTRFLNIKNFWETDNGNKLGNGCFGVVYSATVQGKMVAVKTLNEDTEEKDVVSLLTEIKFLSNLEPHHNIVSFLGYWIEESTERMFWDTSEHSFVMIRF